MGYKGLYNPYQYDLFSDENEKPSPANGFQLPAEQTAGVNAPGGMALAAENKPGAYYTGPPSILAQGKPQDPTTAFPYSSDFLSKYYANGASAGQSSMGLPASISSPAIVDNPAASAAQTSAPQKSSSILLGNQPSGSMTSSGSNTNDYDFMSDVNAYLAKKDSTPPAIGASTNPLVKDADANKSGSFFTPPNAGGYTATLDPTGGYSIPGDVAEGEAAPPEGTFGGYDEDGNRVSINPEKAKDYNEGWRPEGNPDKKCPEGQKWDPKRKQCYKETKGTFEAEANMLIAGIRGLGDLVGRKGQREEEMRFRNMTLADNFMASKPQTGFKTRGMYDVNTFGIPNAGVYATNYVQPAEQLAYRKQGGDVMYLNDKEILDIINMGGQVEFLD